MLNKSDPLRYVASGSKNPKSNFYYMLLLFLESWLANGLKDISLRVIFLELFDSNFSGMQ